MLPEQSDDVPLPSCPIQDQPSSLLANNLAEHSPNQLTISSFYPKHLLDLNLTYSSESSLQKYFNVIFYFEPINTYPYLNVYFFNLWLPRKYQIKVYIGVIPADLLVFLKVVV